MKKSEKWIFLKNQNFSLPSKPPFSRPFYTLPYPPHSRPEHDIDPHEIIFFKALDTQWPQKGLTQISSKNPKTIYLLVKTEAIIALCNATSLNNQNFIQILIEKEFLRLLITSINENKEEKLLENLL